MCNCRTRPFILVAVSFVAAGVLARAEDKPAAFPFQDGDRVAWVGSSSTAIGVWPKTVEYLMRTRHPGTRLEFKRFTTGGGTFATGLENLDKWLTDYKPTVVVFNYGGNDAGGGEKGLPTFKENMTKAHDRVKEMGARVLFCTPQSGDVRKAGDAALARRKLYAETMIAFGKEKGWSVVDVHHPLDDLQRNGRQDDEAYTILKDTIHLTNPAYIGWGYYFYERLHPPEAISDARLTADGKVTKAVGCKIEDVKADASGLSFLRSDVVLPILPPEALPSRKHVPLEKWSAYLLTVTGLPEAEYEVRAEGKLVGTADAKALAGGVNLNALLLASNRPAPWEPLAKELWAGKSLEQIGKTHWQFEVRKKPATVRPASFQLYYGSDAAILDRMQAGLRPGQIVVVESRAIKTDRLNALLTAAEKVGAKVIAYLSIGELHESDLERFRTSFKAEKSSTRFKSVEDVLIGRNEAFRSHRVDALSEAWQAFVHQEAARLQARKFHGLFLDTVDTVDVYIGKKDWPIERRVESVQAMMNLVRSLKARDLDRYLLMNRGLNTIGAKVFVGDAKGVEIAGLNLLGGDAHNPDGVLYENAFASEEAWTKSKEKLLRDIQTRGRVTVFALGYQETGRDKAAFFKKSADAGFVPAWASSSATLHQELTQGP